MSRMNDYYINNLAEKFKTHFEIQTGKKIENLSNFDMTEVLNLYGVDIEFEDLYENQYKLEAYIYKIEHKEYDYKIIIDTKKADKLKENNYNNWNLYILELFYHIIYDFQTRKTKIKKGEIIYPNSNYVKNFLEVKKNKKKTKTLKK